VQKNQIALAKFSFAVASMRSLCSLAVVSAVYVLFASFDHVAAEFNDEKPGVRLDQLGFYGREQFNKTMIRANSKF
jgi:hypothetical protein